MRGEPWDARVAAFDMRGNLVASVARGATPERVVCVARCVSGAAGCLVSAVTVITEPGRRALWAVAVSVSEQDGDEHVGQPALVGAWVAA
jgi:hypothetical protein